MHFHTTPANTFTRPTRAGGGPAPPHSESSSGSSGALTQCAHLQSFGARERRHALHTRIEMHATRAHVSTKMLETRTPEPPSSCLPHSRSLSPLRQRAQTQTRAHARTRTPYTRALTQAPPPPAHRCVHPPALGVPPRPTRRPPPHSPLALPRLPPRTPTHTCTSETPARRRPSAGRAGHGKCTHRGHLPRTPRLLQLPVSAGNRIR